MLFIHCFYSLIRSVLDDFAGILEDAVLGDQAADIAGGIDGAVASHDGAGIVHCVTAYFHPVAYHNPSFLYNRINHLRTVVNHKILNKSKLLLDKIGY